MYYIDHIDTNKKLYGVADSNDGIIEMLSQKDFNNYVSNGIEILTWDKAKTVITGKMNRICNYHLWNKVKRGSSGDEMLEYLRKYSVYHISEILNKFGTAIDFSKKCKIFDYSITSNYYIMTFYLVNGSIVVLRIDSDYDVEINMLGNFHFEDYPSCSGDFLRRYLRQKGFDVTNIIDSPYLVLYSQNSSEILLVNHYDMINSNVLVRRL